MQCRQTHTMHTNTHSADYHTCKSRLTHTLQIMQKQTDTHIADPHTECRLTHTHCRLTHPVQTDIHNANYRTQCRLTRMQCTGKKKCRMTHMQSLPLATESQGGEKVRETGFPNSQDQALCLYVPLTAARSTFLEFRVHFGAYPAGSPACT